MSRSKIKFGIITLGIIIIILVVLYWGSIHFENSWRNEAQESLRQHKMDATELLTEADINYLPEPVKRYLHYTGVVGKPKVVNMRVVMEVQMREKGKEFFPAESVQYNFFREPTRLFFMKGKMFGITVPGYHHYINGKAVMDIRLFGLFSIIKKEGAEMDKTEIVTLFNDMCLMAPATLIDKRIQWQAIDDNTAKAIFTNHNIVVSAVLYFNANGQLVNFISNDRTEVNTMKNYPFSTPVHNYQSLNGYNLFHTGDAVWEYPDGKFVYGKFKLKEIVYNIAEIK